MQRPPSRVVLDSRCALPRQARLFRDAPKVPLVVFTGEDASELAIEELEEAGAQVHPVRRDPEGVSLDAVLEICWETGIRSILCEGGATLARSLLKGRKAQRIFLFVAPFVLGEKGVPAFPLEGTEGIWEEWSPSFPPKAFGRDVLLTLDRTT